MTSYDNYLAEVRAVLHSADKVLTASEIAEVEHLIQHDEPAEGLRALAWIIVEENKKVSAKTISGIRELTAGLLDPAHLPPNLDHYTDE